MNGSGQNLLECVDIRKSFSRRGGELRILDGINLSVRPGEVVVIFGRSGAGKSTLLSLLGGLDNPSSGRVLFNGLDTTTYSSTQWATLRRESIGYIFQSFNLLPTLNAWENVAIGLSRRGLQKSERRAKAEALLRDIGLKNRFDHLPSEMSMGEQQRVAVARALVNNPRLVLADEPTGEVDVETGRGIVSHLAGMVKQTSAALVVVTHGTFVMDNADSRYNLDSGRLIRA